eukprot:TRINITY_DN39169_c0_g1_i7.p1 TRINITY_DN39169_c0_g1~~TRINITY_DN39169_c0_g1_i7.p1  ORF type:complete len:643 (-),score=59.91 TRINITY_DN39169_c0_g1_i7:81-1949(-)
MGHSYSTCTACDTSCIGDGPQIINASRAAESLTELPSKPTGDTQQESFASPPFRQARSLVNSTLYPMYVVPYEDFLKMERVEAHQHLKKAGVLREFSPEMGQTIFVSHQWVGASFPDPAFEQLACLQKALKNLMDGTAQVALSFHEVVFRKVDPVVTADDLKAEPLFIWYDYFSCPQLAAREEGQAVGEELGKAVDSIPAYIEQSEFFFILAPRCQRAETNEELSYQSWRSRGWCRAERAARMLMTSKKRMTVVTSPHHLQAADTLESFLVSVGLGHFTVDADKARIAPFIIAMIRKKLARIPDKLSHEYRLLNCLKSVILRGLPLASPRGRHGDVFSELSHEVSDAGQGLAAFLNDLGFTNACAEEAGWTPLGYAALTGDCNLIQQLLDAKANPGLGIDKEPALNLSKGSLPSDICAVLCHNDALELLLNFEVATRGQVCEAQLTSGLFNSVFVDNDAGVDVLLKFGGDINATNHAGASLAATAAHRGCEACLALMLQRNKQLCESPTIKPMILAGVGPGTSTTVRLLLDAKANVNTVDGMWATDFWKQGGLFREAADAFASGQRDMMRRLLYHWHGATPLISCVAARKLDCVELLLDAKATNEAKQLWRLRSPWSSQLTS